MVSAARLLLAATFCGLYACGPVAPQPQDRDGKPLPGKLSTALGTGRQGFDGDGHAPGASWLNEPTEVGFDADDRLYIVDWNNHRLRRLRDGKLETLVGSRLPGDWPPDVDPQATLDGTTLAINHPMDIAFGSDGLAYLAAWHNHKLLELEPDAGSVRRLAGGDRPGYAGDGESSQAALLNFPSSVVVDASGALLVADQRNNVVRRIDNVLDHVITTSVGVKAASGYAGDEAAAAQAELGLCPYDEAGGSDNPGPGGAIALDDAGNLYIADTYNHCVRRVLAGDDGLVGSGDPEQETIETFAGECSVPGFSAELEPDALLLRTPRDVEIHDGALFIADTGNSLIWRVELSSKKASRVAGNGKDEPLAEAAPPLEASLHQPYGIGFDASGNLFIADTLSHRILVLGATDAD